jgi:hypothetical protein
LSFDEAQVFVHIVAARGPQSAQSVPSAQMEYIEPGPPSSHSLSYAVSHVFVHCALAVEAKPSVPAAQQNSVVRNKFFKFIAAPRVR